MDNIESIDNTEQLAASANNQGINSDIRMKTKNYSHKAAYIAASVACIGSVGFGFTMEYSSPALIQLNKNTTVAKLRLNPLNTAWFTSLVTFGALFGGPLAGFFIERIGRKTTLLLVSMPYAIGWLLIIYAESVAMLLIGRGVTGLAVGMTSLIVPVYIAEIASANIRGTLGSLNQLSVTIGFLFGALLALGLNWNYLALAGLILAVLLAIGMAFMPETPRYLIAKGNRPLATKQLRWLRGATADINVELYDIEENLNAEQPMSISEFKNPALFKPLLVSIGLMVFQQFSGINAVLLYCTEILEKAGFTNPNLVNVIANAVQVGATFISVLLVDRLGRRILLIFPAIAMAISCVLFGVYYYIKVPHTSNLNWLAMLSLFIYLLAFSLGWGAIPWLMMSEIFPARARGIASGIATFVNWTLAFIVSFSFVYMKAAMKLYGTFWFFAAWNVLAIIFVFFFVPETKGKTLEEIEAIYDRSKKNDHVF